MMPDAPTPIVTTEALDLIRETAATGATISRIRNLLFRQNGVWYRDDDILNAAEQLGVTITPTHREYEMQGGMVRPVEISAVRGARQPDKVRLVKPGTFRTVGGYRLGRVGR